MELPPFAKEPARPHTRSVGSTRRVTKNRFEDCMDPLIIALICFVIAAALAVADLFVPSGGILALSSFLAAVMSVFFAFRSSPTAGTAMLIVILVAIPIFIVVALRVWPHTPLGRRIILRTPEAVAAKQAPTIEPLHELIGQVGVSQNSLMPSGYVRINHRNFNAVCESDIIEAGQNVEVIAVRQNNLVVVPTTLPLRPKAMDGQDAKKAKLGESLLDQPAEELGLDSLEG